MGALDRSSRRARVTQIRRLRRAADWLLRNRKTGAITVVQFPNPPIIVFGVAAAIRRFVHPDGNVGTAVSFVATGSLLWWAMDELIRGVNPFRRLLGFVVLAATTVGIFTT